MSWTQAAGKAIARGETLRESIADEIGRFYDLLTESLVTGDPRWLEPFLQGWLDSQARSDISGEDVPPSLVPVLHALREALLETATHSLSPEEAMQLVTAVDPIFSRSSEFVARQEVRQGMAVVSSRLAEVQYALERLDRSKSTFIAVAAHELKTPLTLIEGYSSMLRELLNGGPSHAPLLLDGVSKGARRLKEIIDDMIDVSKIDNNMLSLHFQPVWLRQLIDLARGALEETLAERQLTFVVHEFAGDHEMTFADPERLLQAILNVLRNAVKYTPDGGQIAIHGRVLPGFIEMTVTDSGIGIAPEDQTRIFEKFGRVGDPSLHSSSKTHFMGGGPGLGLPIAKGILEAHGGAIWAESPGFDKEALPGSTFHLMIPLRSSPPDDKSARLFGLAEADHTPVESELPESAAGDAAS